MDDDAAQEQQNWDWDTMATHAAAKQPRAVVSVAFSRQDFERLTAYARRDGSTVSGAIRKVVLEQINAAHIQADLKLTVLPQNSGTLRVSGISDGASIVAAGSGPITPVLSQ